MIIALVWLFVGLICYAVILRFFPPTPLIDDRPREVTAKHEEPRPFSVRDLPQMVIFLIPIFVILPILLPAFLCYKLAKWKRSDSE